MNEKEKRTEKQITTDSVSFFSVLFFLCYGPLLIVTMLLLILTGINISDTSVRTEGGERVYFYPEWRLQAIVASNLKC